VSITIVMIAVSIPLVRPAIRDGHVREASRQVNGFIAGAKARAAQLGREAGIWIQRSEPGSNIAREFYLVESPLPYMGDFADDSLALLQDSLPADGRADYVELDGVKNASLTALVNIGDLIQFDFKGPHFRITGISQPGPAGSPIRVSFQPQLATVNPGPDRTWGTADDGPRPPAVGSLVAYQITRQPTRSAAKPLQLVAGSCVDLEVSGMSIIGTQFAAKNVQATNGNWVYDNQPVVILFHPSGSVSRVYYGVNNGTLVALQDVEPSGTIYLLVGRTEQSAPPPPATLTVERTNLQDATATWLAIADRTGAITVAENEAQLTLPGNVAAARSFAATGQSMGGR
jgi:hypothetical protein